MEAVPSRNIATINALREALETHNGLSGEDISFGLATLNPVSSPTQVSARELSRDNMAKLLLLLHQKLYTGLRARVFNYIMDWSIRRRIPSIANSLLKHVDDGFWELTYVPLTPSEREELENTEQMEFSSMISAMNDEDAISRLCSGELCKDVICDVEFLNVVHVPGTFAGKFSAIDCFSYSGLIEALARNKNPFTGETFPKEVIDRYSLDVKLAQWSSGIISRIPRTYRGDLESLLSTLFKA